MAVLKCKMCGGNLEVSEGISVCECAYCGTRQTVPSVDNEKKISLFRRANKYRASCEFDKASVVYENIIAEFPKEAEAYWGLVLCKYGIEYVDDPKTNRKIPTCHRMSYDSVTIDNNYKTALQNADVVAKSVYKEEAETIETIRKDILAISSKEKPYDIFICYKETDEYGDRTTDSVKAQEIYYALTEKGYKVFFSRITLEDKLGTAYEPYIFSALNTAKVMLVVCTESEYVNAVWVKNEWSRFLKMMSADKKKTLIPCYLNITPYDLPKEFQYLQGQDMSKIGFLQDLIRGIDKVTGRYKETVIKTESIAFSRTEPLLKRGYMFLEDNEWQNADETFEKVLDLDPENGSAYLGKLLATLKCSNLEDVEYYNGVFSNDKNYKKFLRYGTTETKEKLKYYLKCYFTYQEACTLIKNYNNAENFVTAQKKWQNIADYRDSKEKAENCIKIIYAFLVREYEATDDTDRLKNIGSEFLKISDYKNSKKIAEKCLEKAYNNLMQIYETTDNTDELKYISSKFLKIADYKNAKEMAEKCLEKAYNNLMQIYETTDNTDELKYISSKFLKIADYKNAKEMAEKCTEKAHNQICEKIYSELMVRYEKAIDTTSLEQICQGFLQISDYKNAKEMAEKCLEKAYNILFEKYENTDDIRKLEKISEEFLKIADYKDSKKMSETCIKKAVYLKNGQRYAVFKQRYYNTNDNDIDGLKKLADKFLEIADYKDAARIANQCLEKIYIQIRKVSSQKNASIESLAWRVKNLCQIANYKDSKMLALQYYRQIEQKIHNIKIFNKIRDFICYEILFIVLLIWTSSIQSARGTILLSSIFTFSIYLTLKSQTTKLIKGLLLFDFFLILTSFVANADGLLIGGILLTCLSLILGLCNKTTNKSKVQKIEDVIDYEQMIKLLNRENVSVGSKHKVTLTENGTVVVTGSNDYEQCKLSGTKQILSVAAGANHTVCLKDNGTVIASGDNGYGQCEVSNWTDIVAVKAGAWHTVGLKKDGTVVATGQNYYKQCNVSYWQDIAVILAEDTITTGIKKDTSIVTVGIQYHV